MYSTIRINWREFSAKCAKKSGTMSAIEERGCGRMWIKVSVWGSGWVGVECAIASQMDRPMNSGQRRQDGTNADQAHSMLIYSIIELIIIKNLLQFSKYTYKDLCANERTNERRWLMWERKERRMKTLSSRFEQLNHTHTFTHKYTFHHNSDFPLRKYFVWSVFEFWYSWGFFGRAAVYIYIRSLYKYVCVRFIAAYCISDQWPYISSGNRFNPKRVRFLFTYT